MFLNSFALKSMGKNLLLMTILSVTLIVAIVLASLVYSVRQFSGSSLTGPLPQLSEHQTQLMERLKKHVQILADDIGERNLWRYEKLEGGAVYIKNCFEDTGGRVSSQEYKLKTKTVRNIVLEITGSSAADEIIVIGAHYDTVENSPGANDNGSGVAALLEIARMLSTSRPSRTLRFVGFVNEEPPFFKTPSMGSLVYARQARRNGEKIVAMFSLETIGYYSEKADSQQFPLPLLSLFYPTTGNFVAFVSNFSSRQLANQSLAAFRRNASFSSEGLVAPKWVTGVDWSDHWSFWQEGYPGVMITDTAPYRCSHYHTRRDTPDKLCYSEMTLVVEGLSRMVEDLAGVPPP